jgi:hypothetical protein
VHLAFVSIEENGWAEYNGRRSYGRGYRYDDDDDDDENYEIGEVIDRIEAVSEWQHPDGSRPNIAALPLQNGELCPADAFEGEEPDEQYFHEATGNAGASFERTYRRAALVLWPRSRLLANISRAGLDVSMPYLTDIVQRWIESGEGMASPLWDEAHTLVAHMLVHWPVPLWHSRNEQSAKMLSILEKMRDTEHIDSFLSDVSAGGKYSENENEALVRAAGLLPPSRVADLIEKIVTKNASNTPDACANLLALITDAAAFSEALALLYPAAQVVVDFLVGARVDPALLDARRRPLSFGCDYISDLMYALWRMDAVALADGAMNYVLTHPERFNLDAVLVPAALALRKKLAAQDFAPTQRLLQACMVHLQARIAEPLLPPADARRACAIACPCTHCKELSRFLDDPTRYSWAYKAAQSLRSHIESSIRNNDCDLTCVTETRSRPYVLVCTKNQASYDRRVQQRRRDIQDAAQIGVE